MADTSQRLSPLEQGRKASKRDLFQFHLDTFVVHYFRNSGRLHARGALPCILASGLESEEAGGLASRKELLNANLTPSQRCCPEISHRGSAGVP